MLPWETQEMLEIELPHLSEGRSTLKVLFELLKDIFAHERNIGSRPHFQNWRR